MNFNFSLYFTIELLAGLLVYTLPLQKRKKINISVFLYIVIIILISIFQYIFCYIIKSYTLEILIIFSTALNIAFIFFRLVIIVLLYCEVSLNEAIYCAACAYITEHIVYCLRILFDNILGKAIFTPKTIFYFLIHIVIYILTYKLYIKKMVKEKHYTTSAMNSIFIMVSTSFMVIIMSIFATTYNFELIHSIYGLFSCSFVLYSQLKQQNYLNAKKELDIQEQLWIKHKIQYETSRENIEIINRKCHDLKYQVAALKKMNNKEEQKEAIESIEKSVMIYDSIIESGNDILDTVLTEKGLICNENNIPLACIADGKLLKNMNSIDIYTLFGNMLDNAIEGSLKINNEEERFINLYLQEKANLIFIQLENKYDGNIEMKNGMPVSQKVNKDYHGFGVKSIFDIAEKYNGFACIDTNNSIFMVRITIPKIDT